MPEFSNPFNGNKCERKLTKEELIRAIRFNIASEYEAIQLYDQLAESIDDKNAIKLLREISDDEKVHAGNFLKLLKTLDHDEGRFYEQGFDEACEIIDCDNIDN